MERDIEEVLRSYGLERLIESCRDQKFTLNALLELEEGDLGLLTGFAGEKILLRKLIREQRGRGAAAAASTFVDDGQLPGPSRVSCEETSGRAPTPPPGPSRKPSPESSSSQQSHPGPSQRPNKRSAELLSSTKKKLQRIDEAQAIKDLDLKQVLKEDRFGASEVLGAYDNFMSRQVDDPDEEAEFILSESQRNKVTQAIAGFLLSLSDNPDHHLFPVITRKIVEIFPSEARETYYVAPKTEGPKQSHAKGKIPMAVKNLKCRAKLLRESQQVEVSASSSSGENIGVCSLQFYLQKPVTDEVEAAARWLRHGRTPWPLVVEKWKLTAPLRFRAIFRSEEENINTYINDWPVLEHKSGHELVLADFETLRPAAASSCLNKWDNFVHKILQLAKKDVKDKEGKVLVREALKETNQDTLASLVLHILPYIRPNQIKGSGQERRKISVTESRDSYLLVVDKEADIREAIANRRTSLSGEDGGGHPLLIVVGSSASKVSSYHVSVAQLRFKLHGLVEAFDVFFKAFHVFHAKYPVDSSHIWVTVQRALYGFSTEYDGSIQHSWIKACKV